MIQKILFGGLSWGEAKAALEAATERQRVIAANIANAATPGYQAKKVVFEEQLQRATEAHPLARTDPGHLAARHASAPRYEVQPREAVSGGSGVNDVEVERELVELNQNSIHYQALAQLLARRYRGIQEAIRTQA